MGDAACRRSSAGVAEVLLLMQARSEMMFLTNMFLAVRVNGKAGR